MGKRHSEDYKFHAIKYYQKVKNYEKVCKVYDCKPSTVRRWMNRYKVTGNYKYKQRKEGSYKVTKEHVDFIRKELSKQQDINMDNLLLLVKQQFPSLKLSKTHLTRIIRNENITRKRKTKIHFPKQTAKGVKRDMTKELNTFFKELKKHQIDKVICLDETSIHPGLSINYAKCKLGRRCIEKTDNNEIFRKYTLVVAISNKKLITSKFYDKGGINSERLIELLKNNILKNKKGYLLLMDNARAHKSDVVKEYIKESGNYVLYTVPYQHYLNPVEEYFNQLKHYIKVEKPMTKEALKKSVSKSLPKIKKKNYKNYYNHVFDKSKLKKKETKKSTLYRKSKVYKNKS